MDFLTFPPKQPGPTADPTASRDMKKENIWNATTHLNVSASPVGIRRSQLFLAIAVGVCCSAGLLLTANPTLNQAGMIDPYFYVGYTNDYAGLLERFGPTYYADRVAYIFPARAFNYLFGPEGGYFAFRFVALAAAVASVFVIGVRFYGFAAALLAAVWLSFTPGLPRALLWTYVDGVATAYLLVGAALLVVPTRRRLTGHAVAGTAFAFAVNCNIFVLAICALLGPGWAFFYRRERIVWLARATFALALGFLAAHFALALMAYFQFPAYGLSLSFKSIRSAISLLGADANFYPFSSNWEYNSFALLIPITFVSAALLSVARRSAIMPAPADGTDFAVFAVSHLGAIICLSLISQVVFHDSWLTVQYYRTYFVPGCVFALIVIGGEAQRHGGRMSGDAAVYGGSALILLWWLALPVLPHLEIEANWFFWLAIAAVTIVAAAALHRTAAAARGACRGYCATQSVLLRLRLLDLLSYSGPPTRTRSGRVGRLPRCVFPASILGSLRPPETNYRVLVQRKSRGALDIAELDPGHVSVGLHSDVFGGKAGNAADR